MCMHACTRMDTPTMRRRTSRCAPCHQLPPLLASSPALLLGLFVSCLLITSSHAQTAPTSATGMTFVGPQTCESDGFTVGYSNTTTLFYDILLATTDILEGNAAPDDEYNFVLCPYTVYDFGTALNPMDPNEKQQMIGLIPLLDNSHYYCGDDGQLSNSCVFKGGWYHVLFEDDIPLNNVTFYGLTFERSLDASVMAYGQPNNDAAFINCRWKNNKGGNFLVDNFWHLYLQGGIIEPGGRREQELDSRTNSFDVHSLLTRRSKGIQIRLNRRRQLQSIGGDYPSMYLGFAGCSFEQNELNVALVSNDGGFLDLTKCKFESNKAAVIIANVMSAKLAMYGATHFVDNDDMIGPVFLDSTSTLLFHEKTTGENNIGENNVVRCEGIFLEQPGFDCLNELETCDGSCCQWGDTSCDFAREDPTAPAPMPGAASPSRGSQQPASNSSGGCGASCKTFAVLLPIIGIGAIVSSIIYLRRSRNRYDDDDGISEDDETSVQRQSGESGFS